MKNWWNNKNENQGKIKEKMNELKWWLNWIIKNENEEKRIPWKNGDGVRVGMRNSPPAMMTFVNMMNEIEKGKFFSFISSPNYVVS